MIRSTHKISRRPVLRCSFSNATFDPFTLFLDVPAPTAPNGFDKSASDYDNALLHETLHWWQHSGSTIGALLSAIRFSQSVSTSDWLGSLPSDLKYRLATQRLSTPIIDVGSSGQLHPYIVSGPDDLNLFRQLWHDHLVVDKMIFDSGAQDAAAGANRPELLALVLRDAFGNVSERMYGHQLTPDEAMALLESMRFHDPIQFITIRQQRLTTLLLFECQSLIAELQNRLWMHELTSKLSPDHGTFEQHLSLGVRRILDEPYGLPARAFCLIAKRPPQMWPLWSTNLLIAIDVAINPLLPPYISPQDMIGRTWTWADFYPPLRFCRVCDAMANMPDLDPYCDDSKLMQYVSEVVAKSGVSWAPTCGNQISTPSCRLTEIPTGAPLEDYFAKLLDVFDYLTWCHIQFMKDKQRVPTTHIDPIRRKIGNMSHEGALDTIEVDRAWARAPFSFSNSRTFTSHTGDRAQASWLLYSSMYYFILYDIAHGVGDYDLSRYPADVKGNPKVRDLVNRSLSKIFDRWNV